MNIRVLKAGLNIAEVPSYEEERIHGVSNLRTVPDGFRVLRTIITEWFGGTKPVAKTAVAYPAW